eukprot:TRINITY_DN34041_c0_g1_i1.p2 TRINITY_DN34041_c0_g1~~TRINITY_DN34041_c0_g1_i1.p2  ORF type:complete len:262 (+),score=80.27 TRINITY_DN34041_c0_g1_i1:45-830(+)
MAASGAAPVAEAGGADGAENGQDLSDQIMEYQRSEYALLSQMARRGREMASLRRRAGEDYHSFLNTRKDSLSNAYVDPAVNVEIAMLQQREKEKDAEIERLKEETQTATFHPNSIQGKKLFSKCAHLLEENAELGRQLGEERVQTLRIQIAIERRKRQLLRQRIAECDRHAEFIDGENERLQKQIADVGQCLKEAKIEIDKFKKDIEDFNAPVTLSTKKRKEKLPVASPLAAPAAAVPQASAPAEEEAGGSSRPKKSRKEK